MRQDTAVEWLVPTGAAGACMAFAAWCIRVSALRPVRQHRSAHLADIGEWRVIVPHAPQMGERSSGVGRRALAATRADDAVHLDAVADDVVQLLQRRDAGRAMLEVALDGD